MPNKFIKTTATWVATLAAVAGVVAASRWREPRFSSDALVANVANDLDVERETVEFSTDYDEATRRAEAENKPLLLFFTAQNCPHSQAMLADAFSNEKIARLSRQFVCVEIDVNDEDGEKICEEFGVNASPTIQFATSRGVLLQRLTRNQPAALLERQMEAALTSVAWRAARMEEGSNSTFVR
ncbi:MAG: thioredoxin family protein [Thermoguttaceae bacterium]|nr:thioredoxin family protein [Thermoguttaceae bacterium]